jgi:hypothetical protein
MSPVRSEEKNFIEENKIRVGMISAVSKVYQQMQPAELKQTLSQLMFDSRPTPAL